MDVELRTVFVVVNHATVVAVEVTKEAAEAQLNKLKICRWVLHIEERPALICEGKYLYLLDPSNPLPVLAPKA